MGETYSNGDIQRIHTRIDELGTNLRNELAEVTKQVVNVCIALGKIETHIKLLPPQASRPCPELKEHLTQHKETKALWEKPVIAAIIGIIKYGIVVLLTWLFVRRVG